MSDGQHQSGGSDKPATFVFIDGGSPVDTGERRRIRSQAAHAGHRTQSPQASADASPILVSELSRRQRRERNKPVELQLRPAGVSPGQSSNESAPEVQYLSVSSPPSSARLKGENSG